MAGKGWGHEEPETAVAASRRVWKFRLLDPRTTALDQYDQHNHEQNAGYNPDNQSSVHVKSPFCLDYLSKTLNESCMVIKAGPSTTRNSEGKMKRTSGKTSFTVVLAAISSHF